MASFVASGSARLGCPHTERRASRPCKLPVVRCEAHCQESSTGQPAAVKAILPSLLAAALLHGSAAHAGVILEKTQGRKFFQGQKPPPKEQSAPQPGGGGGGLSLPSFPSFSAPSLPSFSAPSLPSVSLPGIKTPEVKAPGGLDLDPKFIALPAVIGGIGAAAFAASKLDSGFGEFMNESMVKDSTNYTGYEEDPPQGRGSPQGFLGLGNLYPPAVPGGEAVTSKIKSASSQVKTPKLPLPKIGGKGTQPIGKAAQKAAQKAKGKAKGGAGGLKGLFGK